MNVFKTTLIAAALATAGFAGNAAAADLTDTFDVRITILETCNVLTASDINFGSTVPTAGADAPSARRTWMPLHGPPSWSCTQMREPALAVTTTPGTLTSAGGCG